MNITYINPYVQLRRRLRVLPQKLLGAHAAVKHGVHPLLQLVFDEEIPASEMLAFL